jgi:phthiocerol/phenolphthiocerol synthesis type-I polyketide synthase E
MASADSSAIAVIGMAARFPGAPSVDAYWRNLASGIESVTQFSDEELRAAGVSDALLAHPRYVKAKPILNGIDLFDAAFFGMSAHEASITDPQHRVFLELCHEALEDAGCASDTRGGATGVFAGAGLSAYLLHNLSGSDEPAGAHLGIGNVQDFLATRVAYKLNLKGPAYSVQSACSTSLVAIHLACQNLLAFECDVALAGGVSIGLPMRGGYLYQADGMVSPDGHCRPFDAAAKGTVFGSGAGVVVLKRLEDAVSAGDTIHAVVLGSAVNNDGAAKAGFTAPSVGGQAAVITEALATAGVDAASIAYIEAHGTATPLGDPIEIEGLTRAFRTHTDRRQFCAIGSVKSNIGHLDTAAGVAGFIKTVLALRHHTLPPSLHFEHPNPRIDFASTPFFVNTAPRAWPNGVRRAGVSAFGIGGTNAHVVLQEAPAPGRSGPSARTWHVLPVAARTASALEQSTTNLADFLDDHPDTPLADAAYTLQVGRRPGEHRLVAVARDTDEAIDQLLDRPRQHVFTAAQKAVVRPLVFMFPGQGAQHVEMGVELYQDEPIFRRELDRCRALLTATDSEQAALFAIEYALARLWMSWGLEPEALIGMSIGECTAAAIAGVMSLDDACTLVSARSRLIAELPPGTMLAVPLPADDLRLLLDDAVSVALVNGPASSVVAGSVDAVAAVARRLAARGVATRTLETRSAYHSPLVDAILSRFADAIAGITLHAPRIPIVSGTTGRVLSAADATDPQYWVRQLRATVYFSDGIRELLKDASRVFLEVGPGQTLSTLTRQNAERGTAPIVLSSLPDPRERRSESHAVATALARLWVHGIDVDWAALHASGGRRIVPLPTYPFERQSYWIEPSARSAPQGDQAQRIERIDDWFSLPAWTQKPLVRRAVDRDRQWLVLGGGPAVADSLARSGTMTTVESGTVFVRHDAASYTIDPDSPEHHERLLDALAADGRRPDVVVHAWCLGEHTGDTGLEADRAFFSVLWLGQALGRRPGHPVRIDCVTPPVHPVVGGETLAPEFATVLGPLTVLPQEYPHLTCRQIEMARGTNGESFVLHLREELTAGDGEHRIAWRGGIRWAPRVQPVSLPAPLDRAVAALKPGGVYVVTGGYGGIGATLALFLAREYAARIVLVGRTPNPRVVDEVEAAGGSVMAAAGDVTSIEGMQAIAAEARARWGRVDGVIHAAGVAGGGLVALKTREAAARVLAPKVSGTLAIHRAFASEPLDFFVVCSSLAALAGGVGQVDYCAANAFLDAWATAARAAGSPATSINWDAWQSVGMAVNTSIPEAWRESRGAAMQLALTPAEGVEVFRRVPRSRLSSSSGLRDRRGSAPARDIRRGWACRSRTSGGAASAAGSHHRLPRTGVGSRVAARRRLGAGAGPRPGGRDRQLLRPRRRLADGAPRRRSSARRTRGRTDNRHVLCRPDDSRAGVRDTRVQ